MRISSSMIFTQNVAQIGSLMSDLSTTQQEVSSGKKDVTGQNATISAQVLKIQQLQASNDQFTTNRTTARTSLQQVDSTMGSVNTLLSGLKSLTVQAQNGTLSTNDRSALANQVQGYMTQLQTLANTTDGAGNYLFSGYQSGTQPYTAAPYTYQGDQGQRQVDAAQNQPMSISFSGDKIFGSGATSILSQLSNLATTLNTPIAGYQSPNLTPAQNALLVTPAQQAAQYSADLTTASANVDTAISNVSKVRTVVGNNLQQLNALDSLGSDLSLSYQQMMSSTGNVDIVSAITTLTQQQNSLTAAEKSFAQVSNLSLFNFMH